MEVTSGDDDNNAASLSTAERKKRSRNFAILGLAAACVVIGLWTKYFGGNGEAAIETGGSALSPSSPQVVPPSPDLPKLPIITTRGSYTLIEEVRQRQRQR